MSGLHKADKIFFEGVRRRDEERMRRERDLIEFTTEYVDTAIVQTFRKFGLPVREDVSGPDRRDLYAYEEDYDETLFLRTIAHLSPEEQEERCREWMQEQGYFGDTTIQGNEEQTQWQQ